MICPNCRQYSPGHYCSKCANKKVDGKKPLDAAFEKIDKEITLETIQKAVDLMNAKRHQKSKVFFMGVDIEILKPHVEGELTLEALREVYYMLKKEGKL